MIGRILSVTMRNRGDSREPPAGSIHWTSLLRRCSAYEGYVREFQDEVDPRDVVRYLVLGADFPRAMRFGVARCLESLRDIAGAGDAMEVLRERPKALLTGAGLRLGENVSYYIITTFSLAWMTTVAKLSKERALDAILIGGAGEKKTLRLVARYADACNIAVYDPAQAAHKLEVLREHCATEGRDYGEIEKTAQTRFDLGENGENVQRTIEGLHEVAEMGFTVAHGSLLGVSKNRQFDLFAERIIPALEKF